MDRRRVKGKSYLRNVPKAYTAASAVSSVSPNLLECRSRCSDPPGVVRFKIETGVFPRNTLVLKTGTESVAHRRRSLPRF